MTIDNNGFFEAREMWTPTLYDILYKASHGTTEERTYYSKFGIDKCEIPTGCPRLTASMTRIATIFNERFALRMINRETLETWQVGIQTRFDMIANKYERALSLYNANADELDNVFEKTVTARHATSENSGTDKTEYGRKDTFAGKVKNIDTPDSAINASDNYADSLTKSDNTNTASGSDSLVHGLKNTVDDVITVTREPEGGLVKEMNSSIDDWRDIIVEFVKEFENNFLNVFWY